VSVDRGGREQRAIEQYDPAAINAEIARLRAKMGIPPPTAAPADTKDDWTGPAPVPAEQQAAPAAWTGPAPAPAAAPAAPPAAAAPNEWTGSAPPAQAELPLNENPFAVPLAEVPTLGDDAGTQVPRPGEEGSVFPQGVAGLTPPPPPPVPTTVGGVAQSVLGSAAQSVVGDIGEVAAAPGYGISGGSAVAGSALQRWADPRERPANMLALYDWIDKGGQLTPPNQYATQNNPDLLEGLAYQAMSPEEKTQQRQHYQDMATTAAAMPPAQETGTYKVGSAIKDYGGQIGNLLAAPGQAITDAANRNLGPPKGYEGSWSSTIGGAIGHLPAYLAEMWMGVGIPGMAATAGGQTFSHEYKTQTDAGVPPETAALNASTKALIAGGAMSIPVARWVETLAPAAKATYLAMATRMAGDGIALLGVTEAQLVLNNAIDKIHNPTKDLLEGVTDPKTLVASFIAGAIPGAGKIAVQGARDVRATISRTADQAAGAPYVSLGEAPITYREGGAVNPAAVAGGGAGRDTEALPGAPRTAAADQIRAQIQEVRALQAQLPPGSEHTQAAADLNDHLNGLYQQLLSGREPSTAPVPNKAKVAEGITNPPMRKVGISDEAATPLIRASDSRGVDWIGHSGILVKEGVNPTVDEHFQAAEKTQPVHTSDNPEAIDNVLTANHVDATQGITWTGSKIAPDGVEVVQGHDTDGRLVEIPADRYAVLSEYGDVGRNAFMASRPGEPPVVAMRDPNTGEVLAIGQGRAPVSTPRQPVTTTTFEARDEAAIQQSEPAVVENLPQQLLMRARDSSGNGIPTSELAPAERTMLEDAGIHPDENGNYPTAQLHQEADRRVTDGTWDAKMRAFDVSHLTQTPETLTPAVRVGGKLYTGATHGEAYDQALRENRGGDLSSSKSDRNLFVRGDGSVVSFEQAQAIRNAERQAGIQAQAKPPNTARNPAAVSPNVTDRPSLYRQAIRDMGHNPDTFVNLPIGRQAYLLARHLIDTIGFKDVRMDPKMQPQKAVDTMLDAYRNLQWMAHALGGGTPGQGGYPLKAMSLNGKLILRLEAWHPITAKAYLGQYSYNPQTGEHTIHMPDRSNSYAHEWTHALDHDLVTRLAQVQSNAKEWMLSGRTREGALNAKAGKVETAFANVMRAMFHEKAPEAQRLAQLNALAQGTGAAARRAAAEAQRITAGENRGLPTTEFFKGAMGTPGGARYWARADEMLARAHEAYVAKVTEESGGTNEFITKGDQAYLDQSTQRFNDLYPHGPERDEIFNAFQELHKAMIEEGTLGRGPGAQRPGDYDILDPIHWRNVQGPQANPQVVSALRRPIRAATTWRQRSLERLEGILTEMGQRAGAQGPPRLMPKWADVLSVKDALTPHIYSNLGQIDVYRQRYDALGNKQAVRVLDNLLDKLGWRVGENRLQQMPFERLANQITNRRVNQIDRLMNGYGYSTAKVDPVAERHLWDALRGRIDPNNPPPQNIIELAGKIRGVLQDMWYEIERPQGNSPGIAVGMPRDEGWLPMVYNEHAITGDPNALPTITRAMAKNFDIKQDPNDPLGRGDDTFIHDAYNTLDARNVPKSIRDGMNQLAQVTEALRVELDPAKRAALDQQRQQLLASLHDPVRDLYAENKAKNWIWGLQDVPWGGNQRGGAIPGPNSLKQRTIVAEARDIMAEAGYLVTRPSELLPYYFHQMGRKLAFAQTFGPKGEVLEQAMDDLHNAGVLKQDREKILKSMESSLGFLSNNELTAGDRHWIWARTLGTMALMRHAAFSSLGEAAVITMQTGRVSLGLRGYADSFGQLARELNLIKGSDRQRHWADIAQVLGITTTRLQEAMLTGRTSAFQWTPGRTSASFYRRILLTQDTNANKISAVAMAHEAMGIWAQQIVDGKRGALFDPHGELRELGIPNNEHTDWAKWRLSLDHIPTLSEMTSTPEGQRWAQALVRFQQKTVLEPTAAEKQVGANSSIGRFVYGLQSYITAFQRMVLNPAIDRMHKAIEYEQQRTGSKYGGAASGIAKWTAYATSAVLTGMMLQLPSAIVRMEALDHDRAQKLREEGAYWTTMLELAFSRVGFGGTADPLIQTVTHLKYDGEISSLTNGAVLSRFYQNLQNIIVATTGGGSQDTNTAAYNGWKSGYQLIMQPLAALGTALLPVPYGQAGAPFFAGISQGLMSDTAADKFATWAAGGPKGTSTKALTPEQQQEKADAAMKYSMGYPQEQKQDQKPSGSGGGLSAVIGLADDVGALAARTIGRYLRP
jgi:hypothetical protein